MQLFIPSVLKALKALFKCPHWLLRKLISILIGWSKPPPPPRPSSDLRSQSDSPYESTHSQQQISNHRQHSPPRPAAQTPSPLRLPLQHSPHQPRHQPASVLFPTQLEPTPFVFPDVAPATKPRSRRHSVPAIRPKVAVAPIVIDPQEGPESLRIRAKHEKDQMTECFRKKDEAKARNEPQRAAELNRNGKVHKENMRCLEQEANAKIFQQNNRKSKSNTIDLHGLSVRGALFYFNKTVKETQDRGKSSLRVIVGKGKHSIYNIPRLKPAIQAHAARLGLRVRVDSRNKGRLVVSRLKGHKRRSGSEV